MLSLHAAHAATLTELVRDGILVIMYQYAVACCDARRRTRRDGACARVLVRFDRSVAGEGIGEGLRSKVPKKSVDTITI